MAKGRTTPIKVCHVAATTEGATWMLEQLRELRQRHQYEVSAIVATGDGALLRKLEAEHIPYHQFDFSFPVAGMGISALTRVLKLAELFRRERYDIVQSHLFDSMVLSRLAAWLADVPIRLAMIAGPYHLEAHTPQWIDVSTWWMQTALLPSCQYTQTLYEQAGVPTSRLHLVYYGPDESKFDSASVTPSLIRQEYGWSDDTPLVGMVAYFYPVLFASRWTPPKLHNRANKRQEDLVAAAPRILEAFPDARFVLVGSGWGEPGQQQIERVRQQIRDLGLEEQIKLTGFRTDVNNILKTLDVSVQASLSENLGGTIESLLMESPTVATRTGGMVDAVVDGKTGVLVEPADPDSLADGIITLLADRAQARAYGVAGRQWMLEKFTLACTVDRLDEVYRTYLDRRRGYSAFAGFSRGFIALFVFSYLAARLFWDITSGYRENLRARWRSLSIAGPRRFILGLPRLIVDTIVDGIKRSARWLWLRPLYIYGYIRHLLRGTAALRQWDIFFARIRGRQPPT
ncbi:MAG: glycosyltransferase [Chloroflexi bacterium]|nr:glycosyltransferase [Chloroflexota bacterium]